MSRSAACNVLHRLAVDQDVAAVDVLEAGDGPQGRGLAAARRPQQHDELAMPDLQVELADDVVVAEVLLDVSEDDVGHGVVLGAAMVLCWSGAQRS